MKILCLVLVFLGSCVHKDEFGEWQDDAVAKLLLEDKQNKLLELEYLEEIRIAQENDDREAYDFYFKEYLSIPRLDIPDHLKQDSRYYIGGKNIKY